MPKFNDLDLNNWKEIDLEINSLWLISERKKGGKHDNFYHGNFVPQIPEHFIKRYTKKGDWVFDPFLGSATTAIECEELGRNIVGVDIQESLVKRAKELINLEEIEKEFFVGDSKSPQIKNIIDGYLKINKIDGFNLALLHPPYDDIIKFSDLQNDLSNCKTTENFYNEFGKVLENTYNLLKKGAYCIVIIGDKYQNSEWIPLGFGCMNEAQKVGFKLKSIIVKNMEGNRSKIGSGGIWKYRALNSDYYIFKHEYILVFKK